MVRGMDLRDWNDPESDESLRRLWVFYNGLPFQNEINRSIIGMTQSEWDSKWHNTEAILADIFDGIQQMTYTLIKVNVDKGTAVDKPKPYPRPQYGQQEEKPKKRLRDLFSDVQV